jgi:hypothetical protein
MELWNLTKTCRRVRGKQCGRGGREKTALEKEATGVKDRKG